jgi:hypothetical protein
MGAYPGVTLAAAGISAPIILNLSRGWPPNNLVPFSNPSPAWGLGILVTLSSGASLTYTVEMTGDVIPTASGNWNAHDTLVAQTASANGNVAFPITGVRLNVTNYTNGSANMAVVQWP